MLRAAATVRGEPAPLPTGAPAAAPAAASRAWTVAESLPGGELRSPELRDRLRRALTVQPPEYEPRTRHFDQGRAPLYTNRLVLESSPYLLQHAHNPVDWYPWGEEAFAAARRLDRPIFLSVGYATCHWCHVMERESFEDPEVAAYLNAHFIPVKVDREERPDVDAVYMEVVMALTGGGGWPMTVVLTPDREPFFGGTYFPPRAGDRGAEAGLLDVLHALVRAYTEERAAVAARAAELTAHLRTAAEPKPAGALPGPELLAQANRLLALQYDAANGGFGGAPKFPQSVRLDFLLRFARRTGDAAARERAVATLDHMAAGGIRDQLGGGFHRYATDRAWRVPHFEKMLYDNALLAITYLDAFQATGDARHAEIAREVLDDVLRELRGERGGFHSATDADSPAPGGHEEEGRFFTWTPAEVEAVLGPDRARLVALRFGVSEAGDLDGRSILRSARTVDEIASESKLDPGLVRAELAAARELLRQARSSRPPPLEDDKVVTSWNGLAISALARATRVLREPRYAGAAAGAAELLLRDLVVDGSLKRSWRHGRVGPDAVLEDYAFLIAGLLDLYEATFAPRWLAAAVDLQARQLERFGDPERGGFYFTARGADPLLFRDKPIYDGALPSGNSVAVMNLLRLYAFTTDERHRREAERALAAFAPELAANPLVAPRLLAALDFHLATVKEIVLVRPDASADLGPFLDVLARSHLPNAVLAVATEHSEEARQLATLVPWTEEKPARGGAVTAYVCERRVCKLPTADPKVFARQLGAETGPVPLASGAPGATPRPSGGARETSVPAAASEGK